MHNQWPVVVPLLRCSGLLSRRCSGRGRQHRGHTGAAEPLLRGLQLVPSLDPEVGHLDDHRPWTTLNKMWEGRAVHGIVWCML
jgi:hypothetical protein